MNKLVSFSFDSIFEFQLPMSIIPQVIHQFLFLSERNPGMIEDLTDLLAEDWSKLGSVCDMGEANKRFFRAEMEKTWGQKHLAVLDEEEAHKWLLGVCISIFFISEGDLAATPRGCW